MLHKTNNECLSFVRWYIYFHSVKEEIFYSTWLSPYENICTIALIAIHYLYNCCMTFQCGSTTNRQCHKSATATSRRSCDDREDEILKHVPDRYLFSQ